MGTKAWRFALAAALAGCGGSGDSSLLDSTPPGAGGASAGGASAGKSGGAGTGGSGTAASSGKGGSGGAGKGGAGGGKGGGTGGAAASGNGGSPAGGKGSAGNTGGDGTAGKGTAGTGTAGTGTAGTGTAGTGTAGTGTAGTGTAGTGTGGTDTGGTAGAGTAGTGAGGSGTAGTGTAGTGTAGTGTAGTGTAGSGTAGSGTAGTGTAGSATAGSGGAAGSGMAGAGGSATCAAGCMFNPGFECCNGSCINPDNDVDNCGGCGTKCGGEHPYCDQGKCGTPPCNGGGNVCVGTMFCCGAACCLTDQLCCSVPGPIGDNLLCATPTATGTCPTGCTGCVCNSPDTPIATPTGQRPIASLHEGELVYSVENGRVVIVPVRQIHRAEAPLHTVVRVVLETGTVLAISAPHPTADGRTFGDLRAGGLLDGVKIVSVERVPYAHTHTYDILPASESGTYFAGGVLIGSTLGADRQVRETSVGIGPMSL